MKAHTRRAPSHTPAHKQPWAHFSRCALAHRPHTQSHFPNPKRPTPAHTFHISASSPLPLHIPVKLARVKRDPATPVQLTEEQRNVLAHLEETRNHIFVTGRAGTGKSTILKTFTQTTQKKIAVCAPTGVAALNVGGQTIHSLLKLPIGVIANQRLSPRKELRTLIAQLDALIIDEISMVNADLMDGIDRMLRIASSKQSVPFGGIQIIMFGDPYQLPPVPPRDKEERAYVLHKYLSPWFFDAHVWQKAPLQIHQLQEVHRQTDPRFIEILEAVRTGTITEEIAEELNAHTNRPLPPKDTITLTTTNARANTINRAELAKLPTPLQISHANITGDFRENACPAEAELEIKVGARVMFLRNDPKQRWVNGTLGTVIHIDNKITVEVDGREYSVEPAEWEQFQYMYDPETNEIEREVVGSFIQFPLRLAWAVTIHKSQGHTYDTVCVDLGNRAFSPGQTYVALSRVRSLSGLSLTRAVRPTDIMVDPHIERFLHERSLPLAFPVHRDKKETLF